MKRTVHGPDGVADDDEVSLRVSWSGAMYPIELPKTSTVGDLKDRLFELTEVLPKRQKVLGLPRSHGAQPPSTDSLNLGELPLKPDHKLMLVGTREADINQLHAVESSIASRTVVNDLDFDYSSNGDGPRVKNHNSNQRKLKRRLDTTEIRIINPPRDGKKLLVLDLDYTLFDCKGDAPRISDLGRPGLHEFLACCYEHYDIVIWSQTSWRWLEAKLTELSILLHQDYKICFVLDRTSMFSITSIRGREERNHEVKALEIIWSKFPGRWTAGNTIHIDDLSRNFALNPQSGLKIVPFKNARENSATDRELYRLMRYLALIARRESDFGRLNHKTWRQYCALLTTEVLGDSSDSFRIEAGDPHRSR